MPNKSLQTKMLHYPHQYGGDAHIAPICSYTIIFQREKP